MLGSCSSSDDLNGGGTGFNEAGKGFVNITLNLPTQKGNVTRANDKTDDGLAAEYNVKDATLLLFTGDDEATAEFKAAYTLDGWKKNDVGGNQQISTQLSKVQEINALTGNKIYAFVVVNNGNTLKVEPSDHSLKVNDEPFTGTFADFSKKQITTKAFKSDELMMTNAVVVSKPGISDFSSVKATTLADVTASVAKTADEATTKPAADIFVERVAAKVTLAGDPGTSTSTVANGDGADAKAFSYTVEKWGLANLNEVSTISRQYDNTWNSLAASETDFNGTVSPEYTANKYRFAGIQLIKTSQSNPTNPATNVYRTYFGTDANYNVDANFPAISEGNLDKDVAPTSIAYCNENTFDVAHQNVKNTTCAIVKVKITPDGYTDGTFYTVDDNKGVVYTKDQVSVKIGNALLSSIGEDKLKNTYYPGKTGTVTVKSVNFDETKAGIVEVTGVTLALGTDEQNVNTSDLDKLKTAIKVNEFKDGYAYYTVLIKHFGDDLTPWIPSNKTTISYPGTDNTANWLGRYGVLRNNWYDLQVTGVGTIGASTPEELKVNTDDTPDDNLKSYISVKINVLSWAKRTQGTVLGN